MNNKIKISWLHSHDYCEHQIYLEHVLGLKVEPTQEMIIGREVHKMLEQEHMEKAELEIADVNEAIRMAIEEKMILTGREIKVDNGILYGKIDEIEFTPNFITIIDDKPNGYPFMSNKKQVWGYCLAFEEQYKPGIPIIGCLRQRDTKEIVWQELFCDVHRNIVKDCVNRILGILQGVRKPEPTDNLNKCRACKLKDYCGVYSKRCER